MSAAPPPYDYTSYPAPSTYPPPSYGAPQQQPASYGAPLQPYGYPAPYAPPQSYPAPAHHGVQYDSSTGEELRTIFLTGFPNDVKERELNNMLRFLPEYQSMAVMTHGTGAAAMHAMSMIAHIQFDETSTLRAELARKNMFVKDNEAVASGAKRPRFTGAYAGAAPSAGAPSTTYVASGAAGAPAVAPKGFAEVSNLGDNPPCSTLFIGSLSDDVSEAELHGLFAGQRGFRQIKVVRGQRVTCFVEFESLETAMAVHTSLQGAILQSSTRGPIRIQYSKNPLGKRKDF